MSSSSSSSMSALKLKTVSEANPNDAAKKAETVDLGNGSDVVFIQRLIPSEQSWKWFHYLDNHIPWTRPTIRVFGLTELSYSGYQPHAYSWDDYPPLKDILDAIAMLKNSCKTAIKELKHWMTPEKVQTSLTTFPASAEIVSEPLGVVLVISAWNYPFLLSLDPVIGAIAAGNAVVLKPSEIAPATSALLANALTMEKPNLGTPAGKAKLMGTLSGIGGAIILTLYEGKRLFNLSLHIDLLQNATSTTHHSPAGSHVWGLMLALGTALSFSLWFITQSKMSQNFPWHYSIAALTSIMGAIQSFIYAICTERDWSQWKLDWNLRLLTAASAGILASGVCFVLLAWCVGMKGPLYVSAFNPLMLVLVAFISSFVLNEYITVGSLTGAALIVCGLYMLLWGKSKEARKMDNMNGIASENVYWIPDTPDSIPANASHRVGVGAFVVNNKREVLVVQETSGRFGGTGVWKMPTGAVNEGEDICDAVIREVKEETGVETKAHMVLVAFSSSLNSQDSCSFAGTGIQTCDGSNGGDNLSASSL